MTIPPPSRPSPARAEDAESSARGFRARISLGRNLTAESSTYFLVLGTTLFLVAIGLVMVLSSSSITSFVGEQGFFAGFWRQATFAAIGVPLMLVFSRFPVSFWKKWAWQALALGALLQLLVFTPLGIETYGNRNWISIGGVTGQPSEFLKLALVVWIGYILWKKRALLDRSMHALIPVLPVAGISIGLVLLGEDLGTVIVMSVVVMAALYFAELRLRTLLIPLVLGVALVAVMAITSPNRMGRIADFFEKSGSDYSGLSWQPLHGLWALANGGVFGVGLGNSKAKWSWLPAADNDYIFAIIGEELGLIGAIVVILLYVLLAVGLLRVMRNARDLFGVVTTGAVLVWIVGQAFVNIGVVIGILPVLGVPLPLLSSGGTALISCLMAIGVVLSIARDSTNNPPEDTPTARPNQRTR
ncbi:hypothetical protein GCM10022198_07650 [Klugiella xanthotipulae]|uniref:Probable peptidoglycan glycosyltransferase FtsW n=1 Tax=Klugiella xanthotipulae TaxID=244735 RepID=A0A543HT06_9MICO|nr:putative lipid II flippase FtsW [Klugiella xanthotipulae]TQM61475.1 cell division-specific peptidoglycan biosynthesis regulator FtsW [Klugiella xanthotipulae]